MTPAGGSAAGSLPWSLPAATPLSSPLLGPGHPQGIPEGGRVLPGGQEPQSQICSQDEVCISGTLSPGPGVSPSPRWPGLGVLRQRDSPVRCGVGPWRRPRFPLSAPPRAAQVPTPHPKPGRSGPQQQSVRGPPFQMRKQEVRQSEDKLTQLLRLPLLLRQEVKGSTDPQLQGQDGGRGQSPASSPVESP